MMAQRKEALVRRIGLDMSFAILLALFASCRPQESSPPETTAAPPLPSGVPDPEAERFVEPIERAQGASAWRAHDGLSADITVQFGGQTVLDAHLLMTTSLSKTRLTRGDGTVAIWDGSTAWVSPASATFPRARFHVLTWPYFLSAFTKLTDPGTYLEPLGEKELQGETYTAAKLTFGPGIGDTPEDWYVLYRDDATDRLHAMAYVVTYGKSLEEAEAEPHAITYDRFEDVEGAQIPVEWTFWLWSEEEGIHGEPIGSATLGNVAFVEPPENAFEVPEGAAEQELPSS